MFRHRKRLISKRLNRLMHQKTKKSLLKNLFGKFMQSHLEKMMFGPQTKEKQEFFKRALAANAELNQQVDRMFAQKKQARQQTVQQQEEEQSIEEQPVDFSDEDDAFAEQDEEDFDKDDGRAEMSLANYVASLSPHEKKMFKQQNPQLPETFFMTKKEKQKYFAEKAKKYQSSLKSTPDRKAKTSKHVQFREKFAFKPFNEHEKVTEVKKAKQAQAGYNTKIHFS